jgi:hypothetical protein
MKMVVGRRSARIGWPVVVSMALLAAACGGEVTPEIFSGLDGCDHCGMVIDRLNEACGWIHDHEFVPFCSPGCLLAQYDAFRASGQELPGQVYFADYEGSGFSLSSETAFLLTNHITTVMNAQVICFSSVIAADAMKQHEDELVTDWTGYRIHRGRPDTVVETVFSPDEMQPEALTVAKGDIVLWRATGENLNEDLAWAITGYPEVVPPMLPKNGDAVELRFMATRPGAGFPIEDLAHAKTYGMLKVTGAHTDEEAAQ